MDIMELTDKKINEIVAEDVAMLENGDFPNIRLENDGPKWDDSSFIVARDANLQWWIANGSKLSD